MKVINWIKKHWLLLLLVVTVTAGGFIILKTMKAYSNRSQPKIGPMVESVYGIGTVTARHTFQLKLGVSDTLQKLFIQEGDTVKKGQRLLSFMDNHVALAPFDGVVTELPFKEGESVFPQIPVLTLTDLKNPYVIVSLEQEGALKVRKDQTAILSFESLRNVRFQGTVSAIYPKDGQFLVNIEVPQMPEGALVGMTGDVAIQVESKDKVLQIPMVAVDKGMVTVLKNGLAKKVSVKLGAMDGTWAEVTDNSIQPTDTIILPGKP
jgi:multidrug efflux pump subunit AcrA (membrane-fusion protein)